MNALSFKKPMVWLPIAMSAAALAIAVVQIAVFGVPHSRDEGMAAHLFQLLIAAQIPIIAFFAFTRISKNRNQTFKLLALQILGILIALAPVFYFKL